MDGIKTLNQGPVVSQSEASGGRLQGKNAHRPDTVRGSALSGGAGRDLKNTWDLEDV